MSKKRVSIEEADNGYLVNMFENSMDGPGKEHKLICKTIDEVMRAVAKLLDIKITKKMSRTEKDDKATKEATDYFEKSTK